MKTKSLTRLCELQNVFSPMSFALGIFLFQSSFFKRFMLIFLLVTSWMFSFAQDSPVCGWYQKANNPPNEDAIVYDRFGNGYGAWEIQIPRSNQWLIPAGNDCDCMNEFQIDLAPFALRFMDLIGTPSNVGFGIHPDGSTARRTMCEAFAELSHILVTANRPCSSDGGDKVFIEVLRSDQNLSGGSGGVLGLASPYFFNRYEEGEIADGMPWLVLNGGQDAIPGGATSIFHGSIWINFNGNTPGFTSWHLDHTTTPGSTEHDLLTVCRHEALHILGFGSFLDTQSPTGNEPVNGNFQRFDTHLRFTNNTDVLNEVNPYDWEVTSSLTDSDFSQDCESLGANLEFVLSGTPGGTVDIFTTPANSAHRRSAFSHLCDGGNNNLLLSAFLDPGERHSANAELGILNTLGYTFTGSQDCNVVGVDDYGPACTDEEFRYELCFGDEDTANDVVSFDISIQDLIGNDGSNVNGISDLELITTGNATLVDNQNGTYTFSTDIPGGYVLRYIPVDNTCNQVGNVTRVYIVVELCETDCAFVSSGGVTNPVNDGFNNNPCNLVCNPEFAFQGNLPLGQYQVVLGCQGNFPPNAQVPGWHPATETPDILSDPQLQYVQGINTARRAGSMFITTEGIEPINVESMYAPVNVQPDQNYFLSGYVNAFGMIADYNLHCVLIDELIEEQFCQEDGTIPFTVSEIDFIPGSFEEMLVVDYENTTGNPTSTGWDRFATCYKTGETLNASSLWFYPELLFTSNLSSQGVSRIDQIELIEDNFDAGEPISILCGNDFKIGGEEFCMLSDMEVLYSWYEASDVNFSNPLLQYSLEREYDGTLLVDGIANDPIPKIALTPTVSTTYVLTREYVPDASTPYPVAFEFCETMDELEVNVQGAYNSNFTLTVCDYAVVVVANETDPNLSYNWDFGDGTTATGQTITHTYTQSGAYEISLSVGISGTCQNTSTSPSVTVPAPCNDVPCCPTGTEEIAYAYASTANLSSNVDYCVSGLLIIDENFTYNGNMLMGVNSSIRVQNGATLTLDGASLSACIFLWDGIIVEAGSSLIVENTTISDAKTAIAAKGKYLDVSNSVFDRNHIGISLQAGDLAPFYGNTFNCSAPLKPSAGNDPDIGAYSFVGIQASGFAGSIGVNGQTKNTFQNLRNGIYASASIPSIVNTEFINIKESTTEPHPFTGYGIYQIALGGLFCGDATYPVTFSNCTYGIRASQTHIVDIQHTTMYGVNHGIIVDDILGGIASADIQLNENLIRCTETGIALLGNEASYNIDVTNNHIYVNNNGQGIRIEENNIPHADGSALISNNDLHIKQNCTGILIESAMGYEIDDNDIFGQDMSSGVSLSLGVGIQANFADNNRITNNFIQGENSTDYFVGIFINGSTGLFVDCNTINQALGGAFASGASSGGGTNPTILSANNFNGPLSYGLAYGSNLDIDPQLHRGNKWDTGAGAITIGALNFISGQGTMLADQLEDTRFEIHSTIAPYYPITFSFPNAIGSNLEDDWFSITFGNPQACGQGGPEPHDPIRTKQVAKGDLSVGQYLSTFVWEAQRRLYAGVHAQPKEHWPTEVDSFYQSNYTTLIGGFHQVWKGMLNGFELRPDEKAQLQQINSSMQTMRGQLIYLDSLIATGNATASDWDIRVKLHLEMLEAKNEAAQYQSIVDYYVSKHFLQLEEAISTLSTTTTFETNQKLVYQLFAKLKSDNHLNSTEEANLLALAQACPLSEGNAVYTARSLYYALKQADVVHNTCESNGITFQASPLVPEIANQVKARVNVYPNPAQDLINVVYDFEEATNLYLFSLDGKLVMEAKVAPDTSIYSLHVTELPNGVYWLKLGEKEQAETVKVIILR